MGLVWMMVVGLTAGFISTVLMPGKDRMGRLMTIGLGIVGSLLGGFFINAVTQNDTSATPDFQPTGLVGSAIGATALLGLWHLMRRRPAGHLLGGTPDANTSAPRHHRNGARAQKH